MIWLQTSTVFWLGGGTISLSYLMYVAVSVVRQTELYPIELLVPEPSVFEVELAIEKRKLHKSPGIYQIPAELIKAVGRTVRCEIHKYVISL